MLHELESLTAIVHISYIASYSINVYHVIYSLQPNVSYAYVLIFRYTLFIML